MSSDQKRLALVSQHFYPEMVSTGMHMTELARRLQGKGWDITVYCAQPAYTLEEDEDEVPKEMVHRGIRVKRMETVGDYHKSLTSRFLFSTTYLISTIRSLIRDRDTYDGLLITTNPPFIGLSGWFISKFYGKPYIQLVYDVFPDSAIQLGLISEDGIVARLWEQMTQLMLNEAAATVVIGRDMADIIRNKLQRPNWGDMHLIPNWSDETVVDPIPSDENPFREEHDIGDQFLVQYSGRLARSYNFKPLIDAAERLTDEPVLFQFIGEGDSKEELQQMVQERKLDNVMFLPYQPLEDLDTVLSAADTSVVCLEERFTGMSVPSKTYGIMASGTPILGLLPRESEIGMTIEENECGVVLENQSGKAIARKIEKMIDNREEVERMGENGRVAFEEKYTLENAASRYDYVLKRYIYGLTKRVET